jgi:UDP-3-O-[3-hydroxymyristoyl] glucosamine N-acyltransferase
LQWEVDKILNSFHIRFELAGEPHRLIQESAALQSGTPAAISFCSASGEKGISQIRKSKAGAILCNSDMRGKVIPRTNHQTLYFLDNPRLAFVRALTVIQKSQKLEGISPSAVVSKSAKIAKNCYVGNFVVIGPRCEIGEGTIIQDNVSLVQNCIIGSNCIIQSGSSLGSDGFAFERDESGTLIRFPHRGYVRIGNDVEISANCSIARGSLSDTIIMDGTKLDALVHVAHNVTVGRNCELTAGTIIGGSTTIGDSCWTGLNSTVKNKLKIGNNVIIASGASVIRNVPDEDIVAGVPARSIKHKVTTSELFLMAGQKQKPAGSSVA